LRVHRQGVNETGSTPVARHRKEEFGIEGTDDAPNFFYHDPDQLAESMKRDLAELSDVPVARLELLEYERQEEVALTARYRDADTGEEYTVEVLRDEAIYTRVSAVDGDKPRLSSGSPHPTQ
jgi:hypothetical protein